MKRAIRLALGLTLLCLASPLSAQGGFEFTPTVGYRFGGTIDLNNPAQNPNFKSLHFESNPSYGVALNHSVHDNIRVEFQWSRQDTHIDGRSRLNNSTARLFGAYLDQYHFNFMFHSAEEGLHPQLFFIGGLGFTSFEPRANLDTKTQFSFEVGGGVKYFFVPRVGLRLEAKWAPTYIKSTEELFCNGFNTCYTVSNPVYAQQGEVSSGIIIRF
jgi:Outer membrane protein beta-barrel domain